MSSSRASRALSALALITLSLAAASCASAPPEPPEVVVAPPPQLTPKEIFTDNFDEVRNEWQMTAGIWEYRGGLSVQRSDDPRSLNAIRYVQSPRVSDATIETLVRINPSVPVALTQSAQDSDLVRNIRYIIGAGIVFRMRDAGNYYMFRLAGEEGAVLGRMQNGTWNERDLCNPRVRDFLTGDRIGFRADNWYKLQVDAYANRIVVYINDEPVCSATDDTFQVGQVGLVTFKTAAEFDYIRVYNKQEPQIR